jgi:hypothetical protein
MTLLPRRICPGLLLATLAIVIALPVTWTDQAPWNGPASALSYAGGSPDETLAPSPSPPQGSSITPKRTMSAPTRPGTSGQATRVTTWKDLGRVDWLLVWKFSLTSVLRF